MELILNTTRILDNDQVREHLFGTEESLKEKLAVAYINPKHFKELKIKPNSNVSISSRAGRVTVRCEENEKLPIGMILMPVSIWANQLSHILNDQAKYKNIMVEVKPTQSKVLDYKALLHKLRER